MGGNAVIDFNKMKIGKKGGGKHWTKDEVDARAAAAAKVTRKKKVNLRMPDWLDEEAQKIWKKTIKDMKGFDILDKVDEDVLATYCDAVSRYKETTEFVAQKGYIAFGGTGAETVSPYVKAQQSYARIMMQYAEKLGLTANSRARLAKKIADSVIKKDPKRELFE